MKRLARLPLIIKLRRHLPQIEFTLVCNRPVERVRIYALGDAETSSAGDQNDVTNADIERRQNVANQYLLYDPKRFPANHDEK